MQLGGREIIGGSSVCAPTQINVRGGLGLDNKSTVQHFIIIVIIVINIRNSFIFIFIFIWVYRVQSREGPASTCYFLLPHIA